MNMQCRQRPKGPAATMACIIQELANKGQVQGIDALTVRVIVRVDRNQEVGGPRLRQIPALHSIQKLRIRATEQNPPTPTDTIPSLEKGLPDAQGLQQKQVGIKALREAVRPR